MDFDLTFFCKHQHPIDPFTGVFLQEPRYTEGTSYTLFGCQVGRPTKENEVQMVGGVKGLGVSRLDQPPAYPQSHFTSTSSLTFTFTPQEPTTAL